MLKNYIIIAARNLKYNKAFSIINILGLALGMSLCMLIITIVKDQFSFDKFHPDPERIFRINTSVIRKSGGTEDYASSPLAVAKAIENKYTYIETTVPLVRTLNGDAEADAKHLTIFGFFTGQEFFRVFGFTFLYGDSAKALTEINTVVISQNTSERFFGKENPVGKIINFKSLGNYRITGVLKKPSGKTHLEFDALASYSSLAALQKSGIISERDDDWKDYYTNYTYIKLKDRNAKSALEKELAVMAKDQYAKVELESRDKGYRFYLQPLEKIVPGPMLSNSMGRSLPLPLLWFLLGLAAVVIISAGFNYNSLTLARSLSRAKEIGIRKASGAKRKQLVFQLLTEAILTALLSLGLASIIYELILKPGFYNLRVVQMMEISLNGDVFLYLLFAIFSIIVGIASGIFPALYLSSVNTVKALKDFSDKSALPRLFFRRTLLVIQFSAALLFVISMINMYRQINYVMKADYGFRKDDMVNIDLRGNNYDKVKLAFEQCSNVMMISGISHPIGTNRDRSVDVRIKPSDEKITVRDYTIDEQFLPNLELKTIAGNNFSSTLPPDRELYAIVNERFIERFNLGTPQEAIGKNILVEDSLNFEIKGVIKDFHFKPFMYNIEPLLLRYNRSDIGTAYIKISHIDPQATIARLENIWKSVDHTHEFTYSFLKDDLQNSYSEMQDMSRMVSVVALMAVVVACLGLFGLVIFNIRRRVKEIGIRKILGASTPQIIIYLSRNFMKLLSLACLIGLPLSILANYFIMDSFAFRVNPIPGYVSGIIALLLLALATIGVKVTKAAAANPVNSLRTE